MVVPGRRRSIAFFIGLGVGLIIVIVLLYVGWVLLNWHTGILVFFGVILVAMTISGVVLNTTFLVREIRRNEQHDAFINAVTHELKTPVASIRLYLETLLSRSVPEAKRDHFYRVMLEDSDRLLTTIEQVLRTGRVGPDTRLLHLAPVDLNLLLAECVDRARVVHSLDAESVHYEPGASAVIVQGDEEELRAAVSNLVENAIKYSGENVRVFAKTETVNDKYVNFTVRDNGYGIPKPELKRIFRRFYRVPGPNSVRKKVPDWDSSSFAPSPAGMAAAPGPKAKAWGGEARSYFNSHLQMTRVLVVEDEKHLADGLRFNLEAEDYEVDVVETGEEALTLLLSSTQVFDVLVLDVMLPGKDGFSVMTDLRAAGQFIPTLFLTARGRPDDVLRGFAAGADDYLTKPFELKILIARLRGLLRRREWLQASLSAPKPAPVNSDTFRFGAHSEKIVNFDLLELSIADQVVRLTQMEANVLRFLIQHEGKPVSRKEMIGQVWGLQENTDTRPIDNFIVRLRRYVEDDPTRPKHLLTVRGIGYRFVAIPSN